MGRKQTKVFVIAEQPDIAKTYKRWQGTKETYDIDKADIIYILDGWGRTLGEKETYGRNEKYWELYNRVSPRPIVYCERGFYNALLTLLEERAKKDKLYKIERSEHAWLMWASTRRRINGYFWISRYLKKTTEALSRWGHWL